MPAERLLDGLWIKALEDGANGGMRGCSLPAQTEGGVQPLAGHRDEGFDGAIGITAGPGGEDREQQNVGQLIELTFGPARIRDLAEQGDQRVERSQGNLLAVGLPYYSLEDLPHRNPSTVLPTRFFHALPRRPPIVGQQ